MAFNVRYVINIAYEYLSLTYQRMVVLDLVVQDECHPFGAVSFGKVLRTRSNAVVFVADGFNNQECRRFEARSSANTQCQWPEHATAVGARWYWHWS